MLSQPLLKYLKFQLNGFMARIATTLVTEQMKMKRLLYWALALGVLFDIGAGTYLWHLISERNNHRVQADADQSKARQLPHQVKNTSSRSRTIYAIY